MSTRLDRFVVTDAGKPLSGVNSGDTFAQLSTSFSVVDAGGGGREIYEHIGSIVHKKGRAVFERRTDSKAVPTATNAPTNAPFFLVWGEGRNDVGRYFSFKSASEEAYRRARHDPGTRFFVLPANFVASAEVEVTFGPATK